MKRFSFIFFGLMMLLGVGCSGSRHTTTTIVERVDSLYFYVTRDSIIHKTDTQYIINTIKEIEKIDNSSEWFTSEWWDNMTRTWTDSLGRIVTEKYEKGNKQTNGKEQLSYIKELNDSLVYYKNEAAELRSSYDKLFKTYEDSLDAKQETTVEKENKWIVMWHNVSFFAGCLLGLALGFLIYKVRRKFKL